MLSSVAAAWRALLKRLASDWLILTAALVTVGLSTVLLATGPIYADAVTLSALQQTIEDSRPSEALVEINQATPPALYGDVDEVVVRGVSGTFDTIGVDVLVHAASESFGFVDAPASTKTDLISFQHFERLSDHVVISSGRLPTESAARVEAAIPLATAELLDLSVGDTFEVESRRDPSYVIEVLITGVFQPTPTPHDNWVSRPRGPGTVETRCVIGKDSDLVRLKGAALCSGARSACFC